ncbi:hypothetical protein [Aquicoccus sp.]|uniref:hypothetical protein n=1 Tax=Aquicoccus sp. TaxID=2055851 RepID=UPI0035624036
MTTLTEDWMVTEFKVVMRLAQIGGLRQGAMSARVAADFRFAGLSEALRSSEGGP